jgi:O-antigen biosynthesis protein
MRKRIKVLDLELDAPPEPLGDLEGYEGLRALVLLHGEPIGHVEVPLLPGRAPYAAVELRRVILRRLAQPILRHHLFDLTATPFRHKGVSIEELLETPHPADGSEYADEAAPLVTVAVCTRDRVEDLKLCLDAVGRIDYPNLEVLVVDNRPSSNAAERLVKGSFPWVRYVREPSPGLDWARNRAALEARGEIIAYTDDDVVVDAGWVSALVARFRDTNVMAVTGLTVPYELETEAQVLFERNGGFGRGYLRRYWQGTNLGVGRCGAGANMAFRRGLFEEVGYFEPALDAGTATATGGDTEFFFRLLKEGHLLVYEPGALARHRHRREYARLRKQIADNSIGTFSYLVCIALKYTELRLAVIRFGAWWFWYGNIRSLLVSFVRRPDVPRELIFAGLWYSLVGLGRYPRAVRVAERIAKAAPSPPVLQLKPASPRKGGQALDTSVGVRTVDLGSPLRALADVTAYTAVRIYVTHDSELLGVIHVPNRNHPVGVLQLRGAIAEQLQLRLLRREGELNLGEAAWTSAKNALERRYLLDGNDKAAESPMVRSPDAVGAPSRLPDAVSVSVVLPTYDRPQDLRDCLSSLTAQSTARALEVIVVDNHPASGLTPPVVAEFPGVGLVKEARRGRSYASNKGFAAARGEILVSIDDDMVAPPEWLEQLVAPLVRTDVAAVTGNTLPFELHTRAQRVFEQHYGFFRGTDRWYADSEWYRSFRRRAVRTPLLGGTGNVAFRASILAHPEIGLMNEALGAGMTGTGEDTYLFYKVLRAGYTIAFEPSAYAWHKHRREMRALRNQIYNYSRGHTAYQLVTLLHDHDLRVLWELGVRIPQWELRCLAGYAKRRLLRKRVSFPLNLILARIAGYVVGPWSLWRSYQRVSREGRSDPYVTAPRPTASKASEQTN